MDSRTAVGLAVAAAGAIASTPSQATPIAVSQTIALNTLLQQGQTSGLQFDVAGMLGTSGLAGGELLSGEVTVFGFSDAQYGAASPAPYSAYAVTGYQARTAYYAYYVSGYCGWWSCYGGYTSYGAYTAYDQNEQRQRDVLHTDAVADTLRVSAGGSSASGSVSQVSRSVGGYGNPTYDGSYYRGSDGYGNPLYGYRYSRERDIYEAISGVLQVKLVLDAVALTDIALDGVLSLDMGSTAGQMRLTGFSFNGLAQAYTPPVPSATVSNAPGSLAVPEPGTLLLSGAALAAALAAARRRGRA